MNATLLLYKLRRDNLRNSHRQQIIPKKPSFHIHQLPLFPQCWHVLLQYNLNQNKHGENEGGKTPKYRMNKIHIINNTENWRCSFTSWREWSCLAKFLGLFLSDNLENYGSVDKFGGVCASVLGEAVILKPCRWSPRETCGSHWRKTDSGVCSLVRLLDGDGVEFK